MPEPDVCDLAVWDLHGELTAMVRRELRHAVRRKAPRIATACGVWRDARVVVGWPRRVTVSQLPPLGEVLNGMRAVHRPRRWVIVGPAAAGDSGLGVGCVKSLAETPGLLTRWSDQASEAARPFSEATTLLAAVTHAGSKAPDPHRPTAARVAGRWLGGLMSGGQTEPAADLAHEVAERLSHLL